MVGNDIASVMSENPITIAALRIVGFTIQFPYIIFINIAFPMHLQLWSDEWQFRAF